jgi:methionyl-tRNA synthetase
MTEKDIQEITQLLQWLENPWVMLMFIVLTIWALVWKGIALWKAAQNASKPWFVALLVLNTLGILEIIYIFYFSKKNI